MQKYYSLMNVTELALIKDFYIQDVRLYLGLKHSGLLDWMRLSSGQQMSWLVSVVIYMSINWWNIFETLVMWIPNGKYSHLNLEQPVSKQPLCICIHSVRCRYGGPKVGNILYSNSLTITDWYWCFVRVCSLSSCHHVLGLQYAVRSKSLVTDWTSDTALSVPDLVHIITNKQTFHQLFLQSISGEPPEELFIILILEVDTNARNPLLPILLAFHHQTCAGWIAQVPCSNLVLGHCPHVSPLGDYLPGGSWLSCFDEMIK